jgi:hypothetical protein
MLVSGLSTQSSGRWGAGAQGLEAEDPVLLNTVPSTVTVLTIYVSRYVRMPAVSETPVSAD